MKQPTVLHCIPTFTTGGAERQLSILAVAQARAGLHVHIAYLREGSELSRLVGTPVELHKVPAAGNHDPRIFIRLRGLMRQIEPDVVQTWLPQMDILGGLASLTMGIPWVISERSGREAYVDRVKDRFFRPLIGRWANAIVANSRRGRDVWIGGVRSGAPIAVIPNALPLDEIGAVTASSLSEFGVSPSRPAVIFVGRLTIEKRIDLLLDVMKQVVRQSDAIALICGDGPLRGQVDDFVRAERCEDRIKVLGYRSDVTALLKGARVFVSTSSFEGHPNAVLEAMVCGAALVVSDIPAHREFLDDKSAALVSIGDRNGFVREILAVLTLTPTVDGRIAVARAAASEITAGTAAGEYLKVYRQIMETH